MNERIEHINCTSCIAHANENVRNAYILQYPKKKRNISLNLFSYILHGHLWFGKHVNPINDWEYIYI